jgi:hypothetical protein
MILCIQQALEYAFETMDRGGPAAVARRRSRQPAATAQSTAAAKRHRKREAEERRRRAECEEVESVLARFEAQGGLARSRVRRVERVQNLLLRSDYERCDCIPPRGEARHSTRSGAAASCRPAGAAQGSRKRWTAAGWAARLCSYLGSWPLRTCDAPRWLCRRKARIQLETAHAGPSGLNEKRLWHGADKVPPASSTGALLAAYMHATATCGWRPVLDSIVSR